MSCVNSGQVTFPSLSRDRSVPPRAGTTWGNGFGVVVSFILFYFIFLFIISTGFFFFTGFAYPPVLSLGSIRDSPLSVPFRLCPFSPSLGFDGFLSRRARGLVLVGPL